MHRVLRRMRSDNRGQALILGAVSMLVLALVVLTTMHVSQVVYEKIKLQNAADSLAYSTAVVEARAYNVISYINRAMVLHYSSMMTFAAYLSHAQYLDWTMMPILSAVAAVLQALGIPGCEVVKALRYWYGILDGHGPAFSPINFCPPPTYNSHGAVELALAYLTAANEMLYLVQEAALVWAGMFIYNSEQFAKKTDPLAEIPSGLSWAGGGALPPQLRAATNPFIIRNILSVYSPTEHRSDNAATSVGITERKNGQPVYPNYRGGNKVVDEYSRFLMMEIANASRDEWTAGQKENRGLIPFFGRRWTFDLGKKLLGSSFACGTLLAGLVKIAGLVAAAFGAGPLALLSMFFGMRLEKTAETRLRGFESSRRADQIFSAERFIVKDTTAGKKKSCLCCGVSCGWSGCSCKRCVNWVCVPPNVSMSCSQIGRIDMVVALDNGGSSAPRPGLFTPTPLSSQADNGGYHTVSGRAKLEFFGIAGINIGPYGLENTHRKHYFKGITPYIKSRPGPDFPQVDHFYDPCNTAALVKNIPNNSVRKAWSYKGGTVDFSQHRQIYTGGMWSKDMAALAVGRAYYHRPGAWKDPPNFFNPMWFARLAPVREHWLFAEGFRSGGNVCVGEALALLPADWIGMVCGTGLAAGSAASVIMH